MFTLLFFILFQLVYSDESKTYYYELLPTPKYKKGCYPNPCLNGDCIQVLSSFYYCNCKTGYSGKNCEHESSCYPGACLNGFCHSNSNKSYSCDCLSGWEGVRCENRKRKIEYTMPSWPKYLPSYDNCDPNPCLHGKCLSKDFCICDSGWMGLRCEIKEIKFDMPKNEIRVPYKIYNYSSSRKSSDKFLLYVCLYGILPLVAFAGFAYFIRNLREKIKIKRTHNRAIRRSSAINSTTEHMSIQQQHQPCELNLTIDENSNIYLLLEYQLQTPSSLHPNSIDNRNDLLDYNEAAKLPSTDPCSDDNDLLPEYDQVTNKNTSIA